VLGVSLNYSKDFRKNGKKQFAYNKAFDWRLLLFFSRQGAKTAKILYEKSSSQKKPKTDIKLL